MHQMLDAYKAAMIEHVTSGSTNQIADMEAKMLMHKVQINKKVQLILHRGKSSIHGVCMLGDCGATCDIIILLSRVGINVDVYLQ